MGILVVVRRNPHSCLAHHINGSHCGTFNTVRATFVLEQEDLIVSVYDEAMLFGGSSSESDLKVLETCDVISVRVEFSTALPTLVKFRLAASIHGGLSTLGTYGHN